MRKRRRHPRLAEETLLEDVVVGERREQPLDGHAAPELRVPRELDRGHAALSERLLDGVAAQSSPSPSSSSPCLCFFFCFLSFFFFFASSDGCAGHGGI